MTSAEADEEELRAARQRRVAADLRTVVGQRDVGRDHRHAPPLPVGPRAGFRSLVIRVEASSSLPQRSAREGEARLPGLRRERTDRRSARASPVRVTPHGRPKFPRKGDARPADTLAACVRACRSSLEVAAARAAGRLSRLAGAGGGTTLPGKLLWKLDPGAIDRLAARLPQGSALVSATNGKTTTAAMVAEILVAQRAARAQPRRARTSSRAWRRRCSPTRAPSSGSSRSTRARCRRWRSACGRARSASAISSATSSTATASSSSSPSAGAQTVRDLHETVVVANGDDPQLGELAAQASSVGRLRRRRPAPRAPRAAARGRLEVVRPLRHRVRLRAAYVGHLGDYRCLACGHARPAARRRGARDRAERAGGIVASTSSRRREGPARAPAAAGALQRLQRARRCHARARARRLARRRRSPGSSASARPSGAWSGSPSATGRCSCCW